MINIYLKRDIYNQRRVVRFGSFMLGSPPSILGSSARYEFIVYAVKYNITHSLPSNEDGIRLIKHHEKN